MILTRMRIIKYLLILIPLFSSQANAEFKTITKKEFLEKNLKILEKRFDQIDTNKDQKIDIKENEIWTKKVLKARQERAKKLRKRSQELAKKIDVNKDGKISKKELENYKNKLKIKK